MAKVEIIESLFNAIEKKFKGEAHEVLDLLESLEENPKKGKLLGEVAGIAIKEIKYNNFRFYFIAEGYKIKFLDIKDLNDLLIKVVRMSDKNNQQKVIDEIKYVLRKIGMEGFR